MRGGDRVVSRLPRGLVEMSSPTRGAGETARAAADADGVGAVDTTKGATAVAGGADEGDGTPDAGAATEAVGGTVRHQLGQADRGDGLASGDQVGVEGRGMLMARQSA